MPGPEVDSTGDKAFANLLRHEKLVAEADLTIALMGAARIRALGLPVGVADVLVEQGALTAAKADELRRLQSLTSIRPLRRSEVANITLSPEDDRKVVDVAARYLLLVKTQVAEAEALAEQTEVCGCRLRLTEILVERHYLDSEALFALVVYLRVGGGTPESGGVRAAAGAGSTIYGGTDDLLFGSAAISNRLASAAEVQKALGAQMRLNRTAGMRQGLADVLVAQDILRLTDAKRLMDIVRLRRPDANIRPLRVVQLSDEEADRIDRILEENDLVAPEQMDEARRIQAEAGKLGMQRKLTEILLEKGFVKKDTLDAAEAILDSQRFSMGHLRGPGDATIVTQAVTRPSLLSGAVVGVMAVLLTLGGVAWFRHGPAANPSGSRTGGATNPEDVDTGEDGPGWDQAMARAEAPLLAEEFGAARSALGVLEASTRSPGHRARVARRLREAEALERLARKLEERVRDASAPPVEVAWWDGTAWTVAEATRAHVVLRPRAAGGAEAAGETSTRTWSELDPRDRLAILLAAGLGESEPYGVALFCAEKGAPLPNEVREHLGRGALADVELVLAKVPRLAERAAPAAAGPAVAEVTPLSGTDLTSGAGKTPAVDPTKVDPRLAAALALDAQAALVARIAEKLKAWKLEEGRGMLARWREGDPAGKGELWQAYASGIDRIIALRDRLASGIGGAARPIAAASLPGFESMGGGNLAGGSADGVSVRVGGGQIVRPWKDLSPAALRGLADAVLPKGETRYAALAALFLESGQAEDAAAAWEQAASTAEPVDSFAPWYAARRDQARLTLWRAQVRIAEKFAETGGGGAALDVLAAPKAAAPEFGVPAADRERVAAVLAAARAACVAEALAAATSAESAGRAQEVAALLEAALRRLGTAPEAAALATRLAEARKKVELVLADWAGDAEFGAWKVEGGKAALATDPATAGRAPGSLHWSFGNDQGCGLILNTPAADFRGYEGVALWVRVPASSLAQVELRFESSLTDYYAYVIPLTNVGAVELKVPFANFSKEGMADLGRVVDVRLWHFSPGEAGELYVDDLRLLHKLAPDEIAALPPKKPGPGPGAGVGPGPGKPPAKPGDAAGRIGHVPKGVRKGPTLSLRDDAYVNLEYGVCLTPPDRWETIPPPKEANAAFRVDQEVTPLVQFKSRQPDPENYSIGLDFLSLGKAETLDDALKNFADYEKTNNPKWEDAPPRPQRETVGKNPAAWLGYPGDQGFWLSTLVVQGYGEAYALRFSSGKRYGQRKAEEFHLVARTFGFLNEDQLVKLLARKSAGGGGATTLPPGWASFLTAHYEIQYDCDEAFAKELGQHLEAILAEYRRRFPMDLEKLTTTEAGETKGYARFTVKVFKAFDVFNAYAAKNGVSGAAAYFSPMQNELVAYKTVDEGRKKTFHIIYHEASHQYLHLYMGGDVEIPIWVNEGVADYFYGGEFGDGGKFAIGVNRDRVTEVKDAVRQKKHVPLAKLFKYTQQQYYADAQLCYAEGWGICYFLWTTDHPKYKGVLDKFYDALKRLKDKDKAFDEAFAGVEIETLEKDWETWLLTPGAMR
ncbi:MAG: DUF1570 domain-containing protein [Planctomycetes bacterium]|nr:DUF1570 domain-containing protein [Planctomycetota bacterium]